MIVSTITMIPAVSIRLRYRRPEALAALVRLAERYTREGIDEIVVELRKPDLDDQLEDLRIFWDAIQA
jgi:hypothetical protein